MRKVLFLPFLQLPSGHHQVAQAIAAWLKIYEPALVFEKVDIFSYAYKKLEAFVSRTYLQAIDTIPFLYGWLYRKNACENQEKDRFFFYEALFKRAMLKLFNEKRPDIIICTHALPSYILDQLKQENKIDVIVVNVYTDYFINTVWGVKVIDFHFVPDVFFKQELVDKGVEEERIFVTGIPLHPFIKRTETRNYSTTGRFNLLLTGGSLGVGRLISFIREIIPRGNVNYYILCGKNKRLYEAIKAENNPNLLPIGYIDSRQAMNSLYERMHGIITKPGGVTISECLYKKVPIFVYHALPGQEEQNLAFLLANELVFDIRDFPGKGDIEQRFQNHLSSKTTIHDYAKKVSHYHQRITENNILSSLENIFH